MSTKAGTNDQGVPHQRTLWAADKRPAPREDNEERHWRRPTGAPARRETPRAEEQCESSPVVRVGEVDAGTLSETTNHPTCQIEVKCTIWSEVVLEDCYL
jgi:hypothetical protein